MDVPGLTSLLTEQAERHSVPGSVLGVLTGGAVFVFHTGFADMASGEPITPETRFGVGSITKPITATVILRLAAEGYLTVDDPLVEHIPELRRCEWARAATIRDLLANSSGIPLRRSWEFGLQFDGEDALARSVDLVATETQERTTAFWSYSNMGWVVLGRIIENITGLAWEEATRRHVLEPFGLHQTTFASAPVAEPRATGHQATPTGFEPVPFWSTRAYCSAGTSVLSTVTDLLRFAGVHLEDPYLAAMRETNADVSIHGWLDGWGLGWGRFDWGGKSVWGWDGVLSGQRTVLRMLPELGAAVILATNGSTGRALYRSVFPTVMEELGVAVPSFRLRPEPGASGDLERFAGEYAWPDRRCRVTSEESLAVEIDGRSLTAVPVADGVFLVDPDDPDNPTVTFGDSDMTGRPRVIYVMLWGLPRT